MAFVRLLASPLLASSTADALQRRCAGDGSLLAFVSDPDIDTTVCSLRVPDEGLRKAVASLTETIGVAQSVGRAFRIEIQHSDAASAISDEALRAVAVDAQGALRSSIYIARRAMAAGPWSAARAMGWGPQGLVLGDAAPSLPFGGAESSGVAIEVGSPTVILKARLAGGLSGAQMHAIARVCGSGQAGFVEAAVYPIALSRDGSAYFVIELSDVKRVPPHRVLTLLEIEARRYGARLGLGALLSDAPLSVFLGALATHMALPVNAAQVIETHVPAQTVQATS
ncbi:MAG: hypothetical protein JOZ28_12625 [Candidatus Eremiobacteraeota bacterium]|nr:hypothetical protein [Candidatus Eremiobacteraeota bacterium]